MALSILVIGITIYQAKHRKTDLDLNMSQINTIILDSSVMVTETERESLELLAKETKIHLFPMMDNG